MNIDPHACPHLNLTYDGTFAIVRCMDCDTTWDADEPIPHARRASAVVPCDTEHYDITADDYPANYDTRVCIHSKGTDWYAHEPPLAFCKQCGWWYDPTILNPDNEPTSEHMQWRRDNE